MKKKQLILYMKTSLTEFFQRTKLSRDPSKEEIAEQCKLLQILKSDKVEKRLCNRNSPSSKN